MQEVVYICNYSPAVETLFHYREIEHNNSKEWQCTAWELSLLKIKKVSIPNTHKLGKIVPNSDIK